ncbi:uncharacterized protein BDR25DRAFT_359455 [Lindgomyces ingoldianus]|uniref:Uncharacterized protein n=1 Tax=Lindgomyces ingoldianus TaxID=673940 RepID=A0ACB6QI39_9PLEO|nr:uncharacterized protein BDR25DRAFT_359455 [Lindgomyces ingoldianus]KAF2466560.1 hypothetical protein BDR25DRAFT_359455 [Lindgomyces ingoldianus]
MSEGRASLIRSIRIDLFRSTCLKVVNQILEEALVGLLDLVYNPPLSSRISSVGRVRTSLLKKLALGGMFSLVVIIVLFVIICLTLVSKLTKQRSLTWAYMWRSIENNIGSAQLNAVNSWQDFGALTYNALYAFFSCFTIWYFDSQSWHQTYLIRLNLTPQAHQLAPGNLRLINYRRVNYQCQTLNVGHILTNLAIIAACLAFFCIPFTNDQSFKKTCFNERNCQRTLKTVVTGAWRVMPPSLFRSIPLWKDEDFPNARFRVADTKLTFGIDHYLPSLILPTFPLMTRLNTMYRRAGH